MPPKEYHKYGNEIVALESCLLQTLGFNVLINHVHTVIIKTCQMIKGNLLLFLVILTFACVC